MLLTLEVLGCGLRPRSQLPSTPLVPGLKTVDDEVPLSVDTHVIPSCNFQLL